MAKATLPFLQAAPGLIGHFSRLGIWLAGGFGLHDRLQLADNDPTGEMFLDALALLGFEVGAKLPHRPAGAVPTEIERAFQR